jgi:hypothetical protein
VLDAVKYDTSEGAAVRGPFRRSGSGSISQRHGSGFIPKCHRSATLVPYSKTTYSGDLYLAQELRYLPVLDAVKDDATEGAAIGGSLLRGQVGQLVLLQLTLKPPQ